MTVWEKIDEGYGMCRKYAMKERFSRKKDIRGPVLPFVRLLLVYHRIHSLFTRSSAIRQSFVFAYDFILLFCSLVTIFYCYCSYQ